MNYCTKCSSYYENPGTCNCYATPVIAQPYTPSVPIYPWYPIYPSIPNPWYTPAYPYITVTTGTEFKIGNNLETYTTCEAPHVS